MKKSIAEASRRNKVFVLSAAVILTALILFTGCQKKASTRPEEAPPPPVTQQPEPVSSQKHLKKYLKKRLSLSCPVI